MGKADNQRLPIVQQSDGSSASRTFLCRRCAMGLYRLCSVKCAVVLVFSVAAFLSAVFWVFPIRYREAGFDAKDSVKLSATVQSYFKLQKPVHELLPYIARLEYDVNEEIGVPSMKVAVLSMHKAETSNCTGVVVGFIPDPNNTVTPVALSLLKSSVIDLFLQQYNLTLTSSIFGEPSSFEILKFPGGITIIPERTALMSQALLNFTLNSSIYDIKENLAELKEQLKLGLHLLPNEVVYIQVTNKVGSTIDPTVTVEASVASDSGTILPDRLRQLAKTITGSPTENLGLDHYVFGKVKEIRLSSFLNHALHAPTPSPSPSPEWIYDTGPSLPPSNSPAFSPSSYHSIPPCFNCYSSGPSRTKQPSVPSPQNAPQYSLSPSSDSPAPSVHSSPRCGSTDPPSPPPTSYSGQVSPNLSPHASIESPPRVLTPRISPGHSPMPSVAYSAPGPGKRSGKGLVSPLHVPASSAYAHSSFVGGIWKIRWFYLSGLLTLVILC